MIIKHDPMTDIYRFFLLLLWSLLTISTVNAQPENTYIKTADAEIASPYTNGQANQELYAKEDNNSKMFILISYNIDGRNLLYKATGNFKYLEQNHRIISNIFESGSHSGTFIWKEKGTNKEVLLWEGYLFRYIAEYAYIVSRLAQPERRKLEIPIEYIEKEFMKWYNRSMAKYGDDSELHHFRTHIGSHFAVVAMCLYKLSNNAANRMIYKNFYEKYDNALRQNIKTVKAGGHDCFEWNMTWDTPYTFDQSTTFRKIYDAHKKPQVIIQDVSHGNQVVAYIMTSYQLGLNNWTRADMQILANTLKYRIWNERTKKFSDNIDGSASTDAAIKNSGKNQADGWMKLIQYDPSLISLYDKAYESNGGKYTGLPSQHLQFLGLMAMAKQ